ncbi:TPA: eae protein [Escherichia coli]|nr:eae protein [Escherichia coli]
MRVACIGLLPYPIDGLSGEYAEKSLEEWAEQIRKGDNQ